MFGSTPRPTTARPAPVTLRLWSQGHSLRHPHSRTQLLVSLEASGAGRVPGGRWASWCEDRRGREYEQGGAPSDDSGPLALSCVNSSPGPLLHPSPSRLWTSSPGTLNRPHWAGVRRLAWLTARRFPSPPSPPLCTFRVQASCIARPSSFATTLYYAVLPKQRSHVQRWPPLA